MKGLMSLSTHEMLCERSQYSQCQPSAIGGKVIPIIVGTVLLVSAVGAAIWRADELGWFSSAKGKKILLLGPRSTGKSTWRRYLTSGIVSAGYQLTATAVTEKDIKLADLGLTVTIVDLPGGDASLTEWRKQAREVDHVFYLVDVSRLGDKRHKERILKDARIMSVWEDPKKPLTLVVTHADLDRGWIASDQDSICARPEIVELRQRLGASRVVAGELSSDGGALELTTLALTPLKKRK